MLEVICAAALVVASSAVCGSALWRLAGLTPPSGVAAAAGFALLLALAAITIRLPGRAVSTAVVLLLAVAVSTGYLWSGRSAARAPIWSIVTVGVVLLIAMLPFGSSGRVGLLGVGTNNDMAEHLRAAWTLQGPFGLSSNKLVASGYPIGPHALAATIGKAFGIPLDRAFMGILIAVPALLALAAGTFLRWGPRALRAAAAVTVALCYLQAAYLVQASFKEPIEALFVVAFAGTLYELELERGRSRSRLRFLPLGALAAGSVYVYSYTGVLWLAGTLVVWAAARLAANRALRRRVAGEARRQAGAAAIGVLGFLVLVSPEVPWMIRFAHSGYNRETTSVFGNLLHSLPPLEALGIWPRLDFRFDVPLGSAAGLLGLLALAALVGCVIRSLRRREFVLPSALLIGASFWAFSSGRSPYTAAKALAVVAPVVTLLLARELVVMLSSPRARSWSGMGAAALGGLLAVGAYSSFELLRDGPVAPPAHPAELSALRGVVGNRPTLFLGADDYVHWELRGVDLATPPAPLYTTLVVPLRRSKAQQDSAPSDPPSTEVTTDRFAGLRLAYDFDSVPPRVLDQFTFAIVPRTAYRSVPPPNWRLVETTRSYELWRRTGPTPSRQTLDEVDNPGAILDCRTAAGRQIATRRGVAMVLPAPVVGDSSAWRGAIGYAGKSAWQVLRLGAGRWDISLQYDSSVDLTVQGPGLQANLPASLEPLGPFWFAGTVHVARQGPVRIVVRYRRLPAFGRILGAFGLTRAPVPTGLRGLGWIAATRSGARGQLVPLSEACGHYVDWYRTS